MDGQNASWGRKQCSHADSRDGKAAPPLTQAGRMATVQGRCSRHQRLQHRDCMGNHGQISRLTQEVLESKTPRAKSCQGQQIRILNLKL